MGLILSKRQLGSTNLNLSIIGLGTVKFGRNTDVKYPKPFNVLSEAEVYHLLSKASDIGINYLDTAPAYGDSERKIGNALEKLGKKFLLISKVGEVYEPSIGSSFNFEIDFMRYSIKKSIENLKVNYLDVALLHLGNDEIEQLNSGALENLFKLKKEGLVKYIGVSGKSKYSAIFALNFGVDVIMIAYNEQYKDEYPLIEEALKRQTGVIIKKAFGRVKLIKGPESIKLTLSKCFNNKGISSIVIGTSDPKHLEQNFKLIEQNFLESKLNV